MNADEILRANEKLGVFWKTPVTRYRVYADDERELQRATFFDLENTLEFADAFLREDKAYIVKETSEIIYAREKRGTENRKPTRLPWGMCYNSGMTTKEKGNERK